jgi:hypothetical protein
MKRMVIMLGILMLIAGPASAGKRYVAVPETSWSELAPYVEANIRVEFIDGELKVGASGHPVERQLFEPYDPLLGELASVLLVEALDSAKMQSLMRDTGEAIKGRGVDPTTLSREDLTAMFWHELNKREQFMERLEKQFLEAQKAGRLECFICERGFEPKHLELL